MSLMLKTRKGNTVPFGYKLAEDNHSLEPIENELAALEKSLAQPKQPLVAIVGGAKVSSKMPVLLSLVGGWDCSLSILKWVMFGNVP